LHVHVFVLQEYIIRGGRDKFNALPKAFQVRAGAAAGPATAQEACSSSSSSRRMCRPAGIGDSCAGAASHT
jgi:hypothetical protein